jgi:hypothetical protein
VGKQTSVSFADRPERKHDEAAKAATETDGGEVMKHGARRMKTHMLKLATAALFLLVGAIGSEESIAEPLKIGLIAPLS